MLGDWQSFAVGSAEYVKKLLRKKQKLLSSYKSSMEVSHALILASIYKVV